MRIFILLNIAVSSAFAASIPRTGNSAAEILKQIHHVNDDGSYVFGFEASDGSFRIENRAVDGQVTGRYGYIDSNGELQTLEYVSGQSAGKSLGFQTKQQAPNGGLPPLQSSTSDQRLLDIQYSSVDDDQDGIPDTFSDTSAVHVEASAPRIRPTHRLSVPSRLQLVDRLMPTDDSTNLTLPTVIPAGLSSSAPSVPFPGRSRPELFQMFQEPVPSQPQFFQTGFQPPHFQNHHPVSLNRQQKAFLAAQRIMPAHFVHDLRFQTHPNNEEDLQNHRIQLVSNGPVRIPAFFNGQII